MCSPAFRRAFAVAAQAPASVEHLESSGAVPAKVKEIETYEQQITALKAEADGLRRAATAAMVSASTTTVTPTKSGRGGSASATASSPGKGPALQSFAQWFAEYERPSPTFGADSMKSKFVPSARIYGGSTHYEGVCLGCMLLVCVCGCGCACIVHCECACGSDSCACLVCVDICLYFVCMCAFVRGCMGVCPCVDGGLVIVLYGPGRLLTWCCVWCCIAAARHVSGFKSVATTMKPGKF